MTETRVSQGSKSAVNVHLFLVQKTYTTPKLCEIELEKKEDKQDDYYLYSFN